MILIFAKKEDLLPDVVKRAVEARSSLSCRRLDIKEFPKSSSISIKIGHSGGDSGACAKLVTQDGTVVDCRKVSAVWFCQTPRPQVSSRLDGFAEQFAVAESAHALDGLYGVWLDKFCVNHPWKRQVAGVKPYQLQLAHEIGFRIPETLFSNDAQAVGEFVKNCKGQVVCKTMTQVAYHKGHADAYTLYTNRLDQDMTEQLESVRYAPCIFQHEISKRVEIRCVVIGRKVFAAEIHSQSSTRSELDWRRDDPENTAYAVHSLPSQVEGKIVKLAERLDLALSSVDLILTPDGEYVFLEINPGSRWAWLERLTGLPLVESFAEMLIRGKAA